MRAGVCRYFLEVWGAVWHFKIRYYPKSCLKCLKDVSAVPKLSSLQLNEGGHIKRKQIKRLMNCSLYVTGLCEFGWGIRVCGARGCWLELRAPISAACWEGRAGSARERRTVQHSHAFSVGWRYCHLWWEL